MRVVLPMLLLVAAGCHRCPCLLNCSPCMGKFTYLKDDEERRPPQELKLRGLVSELTSGMSTPEAIGNSESEPSEPRTIHVVQGEWVPQVQAGPRPILMPLANRARPALMVDYLRIPVPFLRLIAVPETRVMTAAYVAPQPYPPHAYVTMPPFAAPPSSVVTPAHAVIAQPQMQGISAEQAEEFCRLLDQLKKQMGK